jgi:hypothetical protein
MQAPETVTERTVAVLGKVMVVQTIAEPRTHRDVS